MTWRDWIGRGLVRRRDETALGGGDMRYYGFRRDENGWLVRQKLRNRKDLASPAAQRPHQTSQNVVKDKEVKVLPTLCTCSRNTPGREVVVVEVGPMASWLAWVAAIVLFPLGLLVFLIPGRTTYWCSICKKVAVPA